MRVLLSTLPAAGHLFPTLPIGRALRERGHEVAVLTGGAMTPYIEPEGFEALPAGPSQSELIAQVAARHGAEGVFRPTAEGFAEMFGGARLDLAADQALGAARGWRPDLVVHEFTDTVGPLVATALGVPLATHGQGPGLPPPLTAALSRIAASRYAERGLAMPPTGAALGTLYIDGCPPALQTPGWRSLVPSTPLRPEPYAQPWAADADTPVWQDDGERPRVLVTFGTRFGDPAALAPLVRALSALDIELVLTVAPGRDAAEYEVDRARVRLVGFTPKDRLLAGVSAVVTHGGLGSVISALCHGIPLVVLPQAVDQFMQAERVAGAGVGVALAPPEADGDRVSKAVDQVLTDTAIRAAAREAAERIAELPGPGQIALRLEAFAAH
ncbi:glycosyltransferase family 1 protein [Actinospica durhamensis]|uniref:Glycosyltransferase family 1 protein n=1 Tax=Actinospica durhamensis TaxID=1508375 RepID=A0A941IKI9_9ACTN|nr:glycosyltransferase [Actinospica durhamensis]MBR7831885.1 glycosyltransferase family 1 protein [Actinospica durhamensis]